MDILEFASLCTFLWTYFRVFWLNDWLSCIFFLPFILMIKNAIMEELNRNQVGCQASMDHEQRIVKADAATSVDATITQLNEQETGYDSTIDEAANLLLPELPITSVPINPFTNPFYDYVTFVDPLADLQSVEPDGISACAEWVLKHQAFFN
ncbi:hypothetical protein HNY73_001929 [Argiope bruennichi]|uniref:Uncharacterized protein n=1 Tax=Argiope bruennichi TaxID=94029 RepID=A0A8T0FRX6_ARGBR|nr:hypothetical protein HNY73_001929 [Argiope bruennichi]